ncbi:MAG TPA: hypothetical protein VF472_21740 [Burkholderiaceae bacterium]
MTTNGNGENAAAILLQQRRGLFAAAALTGLIGNGCSIVENVNLAYRYADAMIEASDKPAEDRRFADSK